jgi:hypothetical protein
MTLKGGWHLTMVERLRTWALWAVALMLMAAGMLSLLVLLVWYSSILFGPGPKLMVVGPGAAAMWLKHLAPALLATVAGVVLALTLRRRSLTHTPS